MQHQTITRKNIKTLVDRFYSKVLKDKLLADFFIQKLGDEMITDEWQRHLKLLTDFWASVTLGETAYSGQPVQVHMHMQGLKRVTFERWLELFFETVERLYAKEAAAVFKTRALRVAENFMKLLGI